MSKIDREGAEKLQTARNALNSIYSKLESTGAIKSVREEFNYIAETLSDVQTTWEKLGDDKNDAGISVIINGKI